MVSNDDNTPCSQPKNTTTGAVIHHGSPTSVVKIPHQEPNDRSSPCKGRWRRWSSRTPKRWRTPERRTPSLGNNIYSFKKITMHIRSRYLPLIGLSQSKEHQICSSTCEHLTGRRWVTLRLHGDVLHSLSLNPWPPDPMQIHLNLVNCLCILVIGIKISEFQETNYLV